MSLKKYTSKTWPKTSSQILSQFFWYKEYVKIEVTELHFTKFSNGDVNSTKGLFVFLLQVSEKTLTVTNCLVIFAYIYYR